MAETCEANTIWFVEIVNLGPVSIQAASENNLRKDQASACWGGEIGSISWAEGSIEICIKDTWKSSIGSEEDKSIGNGNKKRRNIGLAMNVRNTT